MSKLIVQMQMSADGFVSASRPDLDWQVWNWGPEWTWDSELKKDFNAVFCPIGTILLSRRMVDEGYLNHWGGLADAHPIEAEWAFARKVREVAKKIVSTESDLVAEVNALKREAGDIITFGGANFVKALIAGGLVDEFQLFVNPAALGEGVSIFDSPMSLRLTGSKAYDCGIVVNRYAV